MITRSSIAFEDFLSSSIAPQVMPPWHTVLVPSHDLADPGHRISRHKLDLATRRVNFESLKKGPETIVHCEALGVWKTWMVLQSSLLLTPENAGSLTWRTTRWTPHWRPPSQRLHYFCTIDPDQHDKGLLCLHLHQPGDVWGGGADRRLSWPWLLRLLLLIKIFQHLVSWDRSLSHWTIWDVSLAFWLCLLNIAQFLNNYSVSCQTGPNGSLGLLTSTNTSFLFEQVPWMVVECGIWMWWCGGS